MDIRVPIAIVALVEILAPRRFTRFFLRMASPEADDIRLRWWVAPLARIEGLMLLVWVLWRSREEFGGYAPRQFDAGIDLGLEEAESPASTPSLTPGTRRYDIAAVLYHADEPLSASDVVDLSTETEWEMGRSTASATLYRMFNDGLVDREERTNGGSYVYWLTDAGAERLESSDAPIDPNPFA